MTSDVAAQPVRTPGTSGVGAFDSTLQPSGPTDPSDAISAGSTLAADPQADPLGATVRTSPSIHPEYLSHGDKLGRYVILSHLGQGGMGVVYVAYDPELNRKVAIKLIRGRHHEDATVHLRLQREAQAMAQLSHPAVVAVYDVGTVDERVWIAMEFVVGQTLSRWLKEKKRDWVEIIAVFLRAGEGLAAAHATGLVHRDFKPDNVMIGDDGRVRVMDFGLARVEGARLAERPASPSTLPADLVLEFELTRSHALLGTPRYMSPEQWNGSPTDARTDQFSFCVALWDALYGAPPFSGGGAAELMFAVTQGRMTPPPKGTKVPPWVHKVLSRGLTVDPAQRWPSLGALLDALRVAPSARRRIAAIGGVLALCGVGGQVWSGMRESPVEGYLEEAQARRNSAQELRKAAEEAGNQALLAFDQGHEGDGETKWDTYTGILRSSDHAYSESAQFIETALGLRPSDVEIRSQLADVLYERLELAEKMHQTAQVTELLARLKVYDSDRSRIDRWNAPAQVSLVTEPSDASVTLERYDATPQGRLVAVEFAKEALAQLPPGSYRFSLSARGRIPVFFPFLVTRGERLEIAVDIPPLDQIPPGFLFIPRGRFLYGGRSMLALPEGDEMRKSYFTNQPIHTVETESFVVAEFETTYSDYIQFLETLSDAELARALPASSSLNKGVSLRRRADGVWELELQVGSQESTTTAVELFRYPERDRRALADWTKFPVGGIDTADILTYLRWLDRSGRVPGARLCTEHEWERATRGADGRGYPHGESLAPDDANFDDTYGRKVGSMGPDPVGSYPQSVSPFGVHDGTGNIFEITVSPFDPNVYVARGGAFFFDRVTSRLINRYKVDAEFSDSSFGLRVCADYPLRARQGR